MVLVLLVVDGGVDDGHGVVDDGGVVHHGGVGDFDVAVAVHAGEGDCGQGSHHRDGENNLKNKQEQEKNKLFRLKWCRAELCGCCGLCRVAAHLGRHVGGDCCCCLSERWAVSD